MQEITQEMTVRDALSFLSPAQQINLRFWAEEFGIQLREFHIGHIKTYENLRLRIASREMVNAEVCHTPTICSSRSYSCSWACSNSTGLWLQIVERIRSWLYPEDPVHNCIFGCTRDRARPIPA
jgi:hypothetical protein